MIAMMIYLTLADMHLVNLARLRMSPSDIAILYSSAAFYANDEIQEVEPEMGTVASVHLINEIRDKKQLNVTRM